MDSDLNLSAKRIADSEDSRARLSGFGTTKQGRAIERQFHEQLADIITANRNAPAPRERSVWGALKGIKIDDPARRRLPPASQSALPPTLALTMTAKRTSGLLLFGFLA